MDVKEYQKEYQRHYYRDVRGPKTAANKAVAAATCEICGDEWANTHAGWNAAIFVCNTCDGKLSNWDREKEMARRKMEALCQVCYVEPAISLHEASQPPVLLRLQRLAVGRGGRREPAVGTS